MLLFYRFSRSRNFPPALFALLISFTLHAQKTNTLPDSAMLKTVVIQATRTGARSPVPHTNYTAEKIAQATRRRMYLSC